MYSRQPTARCLQRTTAQNLAATSLQALSKWRCFYLYEMPFVIATDGPVQNCRLHILVQEDITGNVVNVHLYADGFSTFDHRKAPRNVVVRFESDRSRPAPPFTIQDVTLRTGLVDYYKMLDVRSCIPFPLVCVAFMDQAIMCTLPSSTGRVLKFCPVVIPATTR